MLHVVTQPRACTDTSSELCRGPGDRNALRQQLDLLLTRLCGYARCAGRIRTCSFYRMPPASSERWRALSALRTSGVVRISRGKPETASHPLLISITMYLDSLSRMKDAAAGGGVAVEGAEAGHGKRCHGATSSAYQNAAQ